MLELRISQLVEYAVRKGWIQDSDRIWAANRILEALHLNGYEGLVKVEELPPIQEILDALCAVAYENGVIEGNTPAYTDLFDTKLMGLITPRPSEVIRSFYERCQESPKAATDWYYQFSGDTDYIRRDRIARDRKWTVDTDYGTIDITINLSKPEKDPRPSPPPARPRAPATPSACCAQRTRATPVT